MSRKPTIAEQLERLAAWIAGVIREGELVLFAFGRFPAFQFRRDYSLVARIQRLELLRSVCLEMRRDGARINAAALRNLRILAHSTIVVLADEVHDCEQQGLTEHLTAEGRAHFEQQQHEAKAWVDALLAQVQAERAARGGAP